MFPRSLNPSGVDSSVIGASSPSSADPAIPVVAPSSALVMITSSCDGVSTAISICEAFCMLLNSADEAISAAFPVPYFRDVPQKVREKSRCRVISLRSRKSQASALANRRRRPPPVVRFKKAPGAETTGESPPYVASNSHVEIHWKRRGPNQRRTREVAAHVSSFLTGGGKSRESRARSAVDQPCIATRWGPC